MVRPGFSYLISALVLAGVSLLMRRVRRCVYRHGCVLRSSIPWFRGMREWVKLCREGKKRRREGGTYLGGWKRVFMLEKCGSFVAKPG